MDPGDTQVPASLGTSYGALPGDFFAQVAPTPVAAPELIELNASLAEELGYSVAELEGPDGVAMLAGNRPIDGTTPIAMAYAGHQFGNWVPSLGDGRAIQIGEAQARSGDLLSIQLKGAGPTPFSRQGDGRAAVGPVLREYVLCEAMHALGIPTTRALAMVKTGEPVYREQVEPGAILARVAVGFVRVGTFQYFASRGMGDSVRVLADYVIERRYPEAASAKNRYLALLDSVIEVQANLIAQWMLVGFIHGVMNTDNMSIMGETIDYGPCAFLDSYDPAKVFSSIDRNGRYAYHQQPGIGLWNLTRFAETLLPLLADEEDAAVELAKESLDKFSNAFDRVYNEGLFRKLGLREPSDRGREVTSQLLDAMAQENADFTLTFRRISELGLEASEKDADARSLFDDPASFDSWLPAWRAQLREEHSIDEDRIAAMLAANPLYIPRNHRVQQAIEALVVAGDRGPFDALLAVTARPFEDHPKHPGYELPPAEDEIVHQTFCGT